MNNETMNDDDNRRKNPTQDDLHRLNNRSGGSEIRDDDDDAGGPPGTTVDVSLSLPRMIHRRIVTYCDVQTALSYTEALATTATTMDPISKDDHDSSSNNNDDDDDGDDNTAIVLSQLLPYELIYAQVFVGADDVSSSSTSSSTSNRNRIPIPVFGGSNFNSRMRRSDNHIYNDYNDYDNADNDDDDDISSLVHTITLQCHWKDQGYGNRTSRMYVIGTTPKYNNKNKSHKSKSNQQKVQQHVQERIVYKSDVAPHTLERLEIQFCPKPSEQYYLWVIVNDNKDDNEQRTTRSTSCGGRSRTTRTRHQHQRSFVMIDEMNMYTLVFDNINRDVQTVYRWMSYRGLIHGRSDDESHEQSQADDDDSDNEDNDHIHNNNGLVFYTMLLREICSAIGRKLVTVTTQITSRIDNDGGRLVGDNNNVPLCLRALFGQCGISSMDNKSSMNAIVGICNFFLQFLHHYALPIKRGEIEESFFRPSGSVDWTSSSLSSYSSSQNHRPIGSSNSSSSIGNTDDSSQQQQQQQEEEGTTLQPFEIMSYKMFEGSTDDDEIHEAAQPCCRVPTIPGLTKRVTLLIRWKEAGERGVSNSALYVVAVPLDESNTTSGPVAATTASTTRTNVWESPEAPHEETEMEVSFEPQVGMTYYIFQKVGVVEQSTNDGRLRPSIIRLHVYSIKLQLTVRDDEQQSIKTMYDKLWKLNVLSLTDSDCLFHPRLLLAAIECIRFVPSTIQDDDVEPYASIRSFFQQQGLQMNAHSKMSAFQSLVQTLIDLQQRSSQMGSAIENEKKNGNDDTTTSEENSRRWLNALSVM